MQDSHDEDGGDDERGGEEASLAVGVLPLPLVHLPPAVVAAATHAEAGAHDGHQHQEQQAQGTAHQEARLVVHALGEQWGGRGGGAD